MTPTVQKCTVANRANGRYVDTDSAKQLARVQYAMWIDGKFCCIHCKHTYESVDDFIERNPRSVGMYAGGPVAVDQDCYPEWRQNIVDHP